MEQEARCPTCGKLLGKLTLVDGTTTIAELYCKKCKALKSVVVKRTEPPRAA